MKEWNREYRHASKMQKQQSLLENSSRGMSGYGGVDDAPRNLKRLTDNALERLHSEAEAAYARELARVDPSGKMPVYKLLNDQKLIDLRGEANALYREIRRRGGQSMGGFAADSSACDDGRCDECEDSDCSCRCHSRYARCSCGASYTREEWNALPFVGRVRTISKGHTDPVKVIESRTCRYCNDSAVEEFLA